jgi:lipopolysaccharide assembly outer membrane protein LptD (OstA)
MQAIACDLGSAPTGSFALRMARWGSVRTPPSLSERPKMSHARAGVLVALYLLGLFAQVPTAAQGSQLEISMDELVEDRWSNLVVARGNVEIRYYGEILLADEVAYDRSAKKLIARGNVTLQDADGKVTRTDSLALHDELRDAFLAYVRRQKMRVDR